MGDPLSREGIAAFLDEVHRLEKRASLRSGLGWTATKIREFPSWLAGSVKEAPGAALRATQEGVTESAQRAVTPLKSLKKGWKELGLEPGEIPEHLRAGGGGRIQEAAKWLGRGGWTGSGKMTKYLPVGMKGFSVPFVGSDLYAVGQAAGRPPSPTGEGSFAETGLAAAGGLGGMIMGGRRIIPSMALWGLGHSAGGGLGRVLDRLRSGANLPTAISAPSPQEAVNQLTNIERYYG